MLQVARHPGRSNLVRPLDHRVVQQIRKNRAPPPSRAFAALPGRKYRLDLAIANQFLDQISDDVRAAILGNVDT